MRLGRVLDLTDRRAIAASKVSRAHRLALADAAMYSMAQEHGASFWTQDIDYQDLPGVRYFAKP
jgi:predicted nucleic acid-binding protein